MLHFDTVRRPLLVDRDLYETFKQLMHNSDITVQDGLRSLMQAAVDGRIQVKLEPVTRLVPTVGAVSKADTSESRPAGAKRKRG